MTMVGEVVVLVYDINAQTRSRDEEVLETTFDIGGG